MPHPALFNWAQAIGSNPAFMRDYDVERPKSAPGFFVEVGYRKDSACAQKVRTAMWWGGPSASRSGTAGHDCEA
jgi:hypothetical protein